MSAFNVGQAVSFIEYGNVVTRIFFGECISNYGETVTIRLTHAEEWVDSRCTGSDEYIIRPVVQKLDREVFAQEGDFDA